jgi:hypothetical protein
MRKLITGAVVAVVITVGGAGAAFAGEVTGGGKPTPVSDAGGRVAGSICAFSGLDDGSESGAGVQPGVIQSWGAGVKPVATDGGVGVYAQAGVLHDEGPGTECHGYASGGGS